jgi:putative ABC transport system permease protein
MKRLNNLKTALSVGLFLGTRQLRRSSRWTTALIISIMTLTFLNLVVISGILVGLIEGGKQANKEQYTGDVFITPLPGKSTIESTPALLSYLDTLQHIVGYSVRYVERARIEANYRTRRDFTLLSDTAGTELAGIAIVDENNLTQLSDLIIEGEFLDPLESGYVVLGKNLLSRYAASFGDGVDSLDEVVPGDRVRITALGNTEEFIVKGILGSKVGEVSIRSFISQSDFLRMIPRTDLNANEITIIHDGSRSSEEVRDEILASDFSDVARVRTTAEAIPQFLNDIQIAFNILGNVIGAIGIVVASITIFIVIFINAVTRRKFIGILKGIGVSPRAIQISYVFQSLVYAIIGVILGLIIIYGLLVPYFDANPLDFPFSDGILVAPFGQTMVRTGLLLFVTLIAGFVPAWLIVRKNTLDSILGRN